MTTEWHERWREGRIGFHRPEVHPTLTDIARSRRVFPGKVFVPLAGKTVDLMWLAQAGAEVVAVELVNEAVRAFFEEQNVEFTQSQDGPLTVYQARTVALTFYQGDVFDLEARHLKDVTWTHDRASLVALSESLRTRYGAHLSHVLPEDVELLVVLKGCDQKL
ncbi:MAG: thiopurine S-methyltransferase, partial [Myxococcota bacterium]